MSTNDATTMPGLNRSERHKRKLRLLRAAACNADPSVLDDAVLACAETDEGKGDVMMSTIENVLACDELAAECQRVHGDARGGAA